MGKYPFCFTSWLTVQERIRNIRQCQRYANRDVYKRQGFSIPIEVKIVFPIQVTGSNCSFCSPRAPQIFAKENTSCLLYTSRLTIEIRHHAAFQLREVAHHVAGLVIVGPWHPIGFAAVQAAVAEMCIRDSICTYLAQQVPFKYQSCYNQITGSR